MNMASRERAMSANIDLIAAYTSRHSELRAAHHFLYDLHHPSASSEYKYVAMGINPGESESDWKIAPEPTQETSAIDFHGGHPPGDSSRRWSDWIDFFL